MLIQSPSMETHSLRLKLRRLDDCLRTAMETVDLDEVIKQLEEIVSCSRCQRAYREGDEELEGLILSIQARACGCISAMERAEALKAAENGSFRRYLESVSRAILREAEYLELAPHSRVLFIGCGAMPVSCHVLARQFGCQVVGLDIDPEHIGLARRFQAQSTQAGRTSFLVGDGAACDTTDFTHIFVASLVEDKARVLEHLLRTMPPEAKVALRFGDGLRRIINYGLPAQLWNGWGRVGLISLPQSLYQTLILSKGS